jgi:hypothetical protein
MARKKLVLFLVCFALLPSWGVTETLDWNNPWPPSNPFPQFVRKDYLPLSEMESITKFRSGVGHDYSDQYESNRSMKHYYAPKPQYREGNGTNHDLKVFSPINGTITEIKPESRILSNGQFQGYQIHLTPDNYQMFDVILFHVNYLPGISVDLHVTAGTWLGYADMRESYTSDIAVACVYAAPPVYNWGGPPDRGLKYLSVFQVMDEALFAQYQKRGVSNRTEPIISKEFRDAHPVTDWMSYNPDDWVVLLPAAPDAANLAPALLLLDQ